jgi:hypothetical protein
MASLPVSKLPDSSIGGGSAIKKRHIRKGTFSCWECKRRKTRCEFKDGSNNLCVFCQRRELPCISQEFPDPSDGSRPGVEDRINHVESLVTQLVQQRRPHHSEPRQWAGIDDRTPIRNMVRATDSYQTYRVGSPLSMLATLHEPLRCKSLSIYLNTLFPRPSKAAVILHRGNFFSLPILVHLPLSMRASSPIEEITHLSELPLPAVHPLQFAKKFIQLALCLHQLDGTTPPWPDLQLNEPIHDVAQRYVDIASRYVTSQDSLMESIDGLETLLLEGYYYVNIGNFRATWLIYRRALAIAQLLGLQHKGRSDICEEDLWFRLVFADRCVSLFLGMPATVTEDTFEREPLQAQNPLFGKLERTKVVLLGRIITRNVRMQRQWRRSNYKIEEDDLDNLKETEEIDNELKQASREMPTEWWSLSALKNSDTEAERVAVMARFNAQMHHYWLVLSAHQPYLLRKLQSISGSHAFYDTYSQIAILSASRGVLSRFVIARNFHRPLSYRGIDDKAFIAASMLALVHIDASRLGNSNALEHRRPSDLGCIRDVIQCLEETSAPNKNMLSGFCISALKSLIQIEAEAASGIKHRIFLEDAPASTTTKLFTINDEDGFHLSIPYFGTLRIHRAQEMESDEPTVSPIVLNGLEHDQTLDEQNFIDSELETTFDSWLTGNTPLDQESDPNGFSIPP